MTLWDRKLGLILGLALFTFACEEPGEIGLDINPENGAFVARYFEIPIDNSINQHEDILSDNATRINRYTQISTGDGRLLIGNFSTPEFGALQSRSFSSFYPEKIGFKSEGYTYDSLVLHVRVDYLYGNNFMGNKRIYLHELSDELDLDILYQTNNSTAYNPDVLGELSFDVSSFDTMYVDTIFSAKMVDELGLKLFDKARTDTSAFYDNLKFREFFKGMAFVSDESNDMVTSIHAESTSTYMRMHFHDAKDTTYLDFIVEGYRQDTTITSSDTLFALSNLTKYYNNITLNKSGTPIAGIPGYYTDFETDDNLTYIQGSAGIFTKLNFSKYFEFLDTVNNLVINRAELIIPVYSYEDFIDPSLSLDLYATDESNRFIESDIDTTRLTYKTIGQALYREFQGEKRGEFSSNITNYIQDLTSGNTTDTLILIGQPGLYNSVLTVNQTVIEKDKVFLRVYYSSVK